MQTPHPRELTEVHEYSPAMITTSFAYIISTQSSQQPLPVTPAPSVEHCVPAVVLYMHGLIQTSHPSWEVDTVIYSHFIEQKNQGSLVWSQEVVELGFNLTHLVPKPRLLASLMHPHQVDANIISILWEGKLRRRAI